MQTGENSMECNRRFSTNNKIKRADQISATVVQKYIRFE